MSNGRHEKFNNVASGVAALFGIISTIVAGFAGYTSRESLIRVQQLESQREVSEFINSAIPELISVGVRRDIATLALTSALIDHNEVVENSVPQEISNVLLAYEVTKRLSYESVKTLENFKEGINIQSQINIREEKQPNQPDFDYDSLDIIINKNREAAALLDQLIDNNTKQEYLRQIRCLTHRQCNEQFKYSYEALQSEIRTVGTMSTLTVQPFLDKFSLNSGGLVDNTKVNYENNHIKANNIAKQFLRRFFQLDQPIFSDQSDENSTEYRTLLNIYFNPSFNERQSVDKIIKEFIDQKKNTYYYHKSPKEIKKNVTNLLQRFNQDQDGEKKEESKLDQAKWIILNTNDFRFNQNTSQENFIEETKCEKNKACLVIVFYTFTDQIRAENLHQEFKSFFAKNKDMNIKIVNYHINPQDVYKYLDTNSSLENNLKPKLISGELDLVYIDFSKD